MEPFDLADGAFQFETQALGNFAAADILRGAFDGDAVEFPGFKRVLNHGPAAGGHDSATLMRGVEPVTKGRPSIGEIHVEVVDDTAEMAFEPDSGVKTTMRLVLFVPELNGFFDVLFAFQQIHPGMPGAKIIPVLIQHGQELPGMRKLKNSQFDLVIDFVREHFFDFSLTG